MKMYIKLPFIAMLALLMWACTNDDMMPDGSDYLTDKPVEITVGGLQTRAGYVADEVIESGSLGFWMSQSDENYNVANLEVKCESGVWTPQGKLLWKNATDNVTYTAAYPYDADGVYEVTIPDVQTNENAKAAEVLYATGKVTGSTANGAINITFGHALAQVKVALSKAPQFTTVEVKSVKLSSAATTGTFTAATGAWSNQGNSKEVSLIKNSDTEFEALLIPQTLTGYTIEIAATVDGAEKIFRYTASTEMTLERGETYAIPVQVGEAPKLKSTVAGTIAGYTDEQIEAFLREDGTLVVTGPLNAADLTRIGKFGYEKNTLVNLDLSGVTDVTAIPNMMFLYWNYNIHQGTSCTSLNEIILPTSIKVIGERAFSGCTALRDINLSQIETVETRAFEGTALTEVTLNEATIIRSFAFVNCASLKKVTCPKATSLQEQIFSSCTSLTDLVFTASAFEGVTAYEFYGQHYDPFSGIQNRENVTLTLHESQESNISEGKWKPLKSDGNSALVPGSYSTASDYVDVSGFKAIIYVTP